jgi:predicted ATPase
MINSIRVKGFKPYVDERMELSPLTVLTGMNGSGKTSLLQAIFLACSAARTDEKSVGLNGPFGLELGTAGDVLNRNSQSPIEISTTDKEAAKSVWRFDVPSESALYLNITEHPPEKPQAFLGRTRAFTYLSAERLGPRGASQTSMLPEDELEVGIQGEFSAHLLAVLGDRPMQSTDRRHPNYSEKAPRLLKYEVEQWLCEIARPIEVNGERQPGSMVAGLWYRTPGSEWVRSTNMGFGITYALPIILAGLVAVEGGILVVENPEAHLHPAGQSRMGVFLAWLAGKGVQVIVETHSDHILNGMRRAIAQHSYISADSSILHFFSQSEDDEFGTNSVPLRFEANGSVSSWPKGFFDQYQIDVATLGQLRRRSQI